jgi:hypothetical protein
MPTIVQLRAEPWWDREVITPELHWLGDELCRRTGAAASSIGTKGDVSHLNGGHRSQEWIVNSDWCTNKRYTVQSGLSAEQLRHVAALDRTPGAWGTSANRARMVLETGRLVAAGKAGKLPGVTQIQGTLDGKTTFGINLPSLITTVPSDSHLDHWHLTFDRRHLRDAALMQRIVDVVLAGPGGGDDVSDAYELLVNAKRPGVPESSQTHTEARYGSLSNAEALAIMQRAHYDARHAADGVDELRETINQLQAEVAALKSGGVPPADLKAVLLDPDVLAAIAKAVNDEDHKRSAE